MYVCMYIRLDNIFVFDDDMLNIVCWKFKMTVVLTYIYVFFPRKVQLKDIFYSNFHKCILQKLQNNFFLIFLPIYDSSCYYEIRRCLTTPKNPILYHLPDFPDEDAWYWSKTWNKRIDQAGFYPLVVNL